MPSFSSPMNAVHCSSSPMESELVSGPSVRLLRIKWARRRRSLRIVLPRRGGPSNRDHDQLLAGGGDGFRPEGFSV
jgi:hypothetical protein